MKQLFGKTCLIDTNILVALLNREHPGYATATEIFEAIRAKEFTAVISSQNILELSAVLIHAWKLPRKEATADIQTLLSMALLHILYPDAGVIKTYLTALPKLPSLHSVDIFLLATAKVFAVDILITADKAFAGNGMVAIYNPFR